MDHRHLDDARQQPEDCPFELNVLVSHENSEPDQEQSNLYFVGASTHPGTGLPTALISARLTAERILDDIRLEP